MAGQEDWRNPAVLSRVLVYGDLSSRQILADAIGDGSSELVDLLASTARSREDIKLRARCIEVLGRALASASPDLTRVIVAALLDTPALHA